MPVRQRLANPRGPHHLQLRTAFNGAQFASGDGHYGDLAHYYIACEVANALRRAISPLLAPMAGQPTPYNQIAKPNMSATAFPDQWAIVNAIGSGVSVSTTIVADTWGILPQPPVGSAMPANQWLQVAVNNTGGTGTATRTFEANIAIRGTIEQKHALTAFLQIEEQSGGGSWVTETMKHDGATSVKLRPFSNSAYNLATMPYVPGRLTSPGVYTIGPLWRIYNPASATSQKLHFAQRRTGQALPVPPRLPWREEHRGPELRRGRPGCHLTPAPCASPCREQLGGARP